MSPLDPSTAPGTVHLVRGRPLLSHHAAPYLGASWDLDKWEKCSVCMHSGVIVRAMGTALPQSLLLSSLSYSLCYFSSEVTVLILIPRGTIKWSFLMCHTFAKAFIPFN